MTSKYTDFFETTNKNEESHKSKKKKQVSFDDSYSLPKHVKSRENVEKGFKEYLTHKEEDRRRVYISPPFEVSRVPSPIYGYHKPKEQMKNTLNYDKLKADMQKEKKDFIVYEKHVTEELEILWRESTSQSIEEVGDSKKKVLPQIQSMKLTKKSFGLNRTLAAIMEEEISGNNSEKRNVPGLFNYKDKA
ncbi:hypothetical protein [Alkalibacterium sp. 20]|uniref:hypothetical protein n=1 Tax=Alkalibacterium sp. 20 TaxID=1798803 RepID=UPI0008FFEFAA|nr:hypothetical protein [Alkalibacterium sp. 20]OJF95756.1 hypothetical protein AX762_05975 [Alkalibacterium sp. 20]